MDGQRGRSSPYKLLIKLQEEKMTKPKGPKQISVQKSCKFIKLFNLKKKSMIIAFSNRTNYINFNDIFNSLKSRSIIIKDGILGD